MLNHTSSTIPENREKKRHNILFLAKWYPNKFDPQLGVFIQKHAKAVGLYCNICVVYVCPDITLLKKNYETVISTHNGFPEITVYYKPVSGKFSFINALRYLVALRVAIKLAFKQLGKVDLVHVHVLTRLAIVAMMMRWFKNIPYLITEHWTGYVSGKYEMKSGIKKWATRIAVKQASKITTVSDSLKKSMLSHQLNGNYIIVPNVIEAMALHKKNKSIDESIKILTVADLVDEHKNISGIIRAVDKVHNRNKKVKLHIIGDGPDKDKLIKLAEEMKGLNDFIFFHGRKPNQYVYEFMENVSFVVVNSNYETFSVVAAEALVSGKPVVATRCGGPEDFITDECGILIEPGNDLQLEQALEKMIEGYTGFNAQKLNDHITQKFSYYRIGGKFFAIYEEILS